MKSLNDSVKLYYLGGIDAAEDEDIREEVQAGRVLPGVPVTAYGKSYMLPPVGGYIEVDGYAARQLMSRHKRVEWVEENGEPVPRSYPAFSLSANEAKAAKDGRIMVTSDGRMIEKPTREELLKMLEDMGESETKSSTAPAEKKTSSQRKAKTEETVNG